MTDSEKLDLILNRLDKNNKLLNDIMNLVSKDTVGREFLLNLGANILGDFINNNSNKL